MDDQYPAGPAPWPAGSYATDGQGWGAPPPANSWPGAPGVAVPMPSSAAPVRPGRATAAAVLSLIEAAGLLVTAFSLTLVAAAVTAVLGGSVWTVVVGVFAAVLTALHGLGGIFLLRGSGRALLQGAAWLDIGVAALLLVVLGVVAGLGPAEMLSLVVVLVFWSVMPVLRIALAAGPRVGIWITAQRAEVASGRRPPSGAGLPWAVVGAAALAAVLGAGVVLVQQPAVTPAASAGCPGAACTTYDDTGAGGTGSYPTGGGSAGSTYSSAGSPFSATVAVPAQAPDGVDAGGFPTSYGATNLLDGQSDTCWRMVGDGTGRTLTIDFSRQVELTTLGLVNGYTKVDSYNGTDRYAQERRILSVTWTFDDGSTLLQVLDDGTRGMQQITVPGGYSTRTLQLTIETTTLPGDAGFDYTAISELTVRGR